MSDFDIVDEDQIRDGRATDAYFERMEEALDSVGRNPNVVAEVTADQFSDGSFEVFAGLKDAAELLKPLDVDVDAIHEGTLFDGGPVMRIEGKYRSFARYETALLGFLSHASGIATAAFECTSVANGTPVYSFGARHVHPALGATVERSALIGGVDGFSHVAAGDMLDKNPVGTMPHALMLSFGRGNQEQAWDAFNTGVDENVPRYILCDTFTDEVDEVRRAVAHLGDDLDGIRLDTTGSRRGDFRHIIKEVRYALTELERDDVDIIVSGGLGPEDIKELRDVVDGFGIGGHISNADPVDFSLDIVELEGESISKRGKLPGVKNVFRGHHGNSCSHLVLPEGEETGNNTFSLMHPLIRDGDIISQFNVSEAARRAKDDLASQTFKHH